MDVLDLATWPCHPVGTWQRALAYKAAGLTPEPCDNAALAAWDGLDSKEREHRLAEERAAFHAVHLAARSVLDRTEVVGARELANRLIGKGGVPHVNRTVAILKASYPHLPGQARFVVHKGAGPWVHSSHLHKRYIDSVGGRPGHFFTRHPDNFAAFIEHRRGKQAAHCDAMRERYLANLKQPAA